MVPGLLGPEGKTWVLSSRRGNEEVWPWPQLQLLARGVSAETDSAAKSLGPMQCGRNSHPPPRKPGLCLVLSAASITSVAQTPPVGLRRCGMGQEFHPPSGVHHWGLCAKGRGWPPFPPTALCPDFQARPPLWGGASHHMPCPLRGLSTAWNLKDECQGSHSPFLQRPSWPIHRLTHHLPQTLEHGGLSRWGT